MSHLIQDEEITLQRLKISNTDLQRQGRQIQSRLDILYLDGTLVEQKMNLISVLQSQKILICMLDGLVQTDITLRIEYVQEIQRQ